MAEEAKKATVTKRQAKSAADGALTDIDAAIEKLSGEKGDVWPVIVARLAVIRGQVEKYK